MYASSLAFSPLSARLTPIVRPRHRAFPEQEGPFFSMSQRPEKTPRWVVRGGIATPQQLQAGTTKHRGVPEPPGLYGFSVQYQPGRTITELAVAGQFRHARISVTTDDALIAAGVSAGYVVRLVRSPGGGYHHTVQVPFPLPWELGEALSTVFTQMANPARVLDA
jgi:hypothetical protein